MYVLTVLVESVTVKTAATPFWIVVSFIPASTHVYDPALPAHETVLPADVAAAPGLTVMSVISELV